MARKGLSCSEAGKIGAEKAKVYHEKIRQQKIEKYNENPKICPYCGQPIPYEKRLNKYCSPSHAASASNLTRNKETRIAQANTLHEYYSNNIVIRDTINGGTKIITAEEDIKKYRPKLFCKCCGCRKGECPDPYVCKHLQLMKGSLNIFGFDISTIGTIKVVDEFYKIRQLLQDFYILNGANDEILYEKFGYTSGGANFHKILKRLDITSRSIGDAQRFAIEHGRRDLVPVGIHYRFKSEYHTTWYGKEYYLRSSYESDYAKILDDAKIYYTVEELKIKYYDTQKKQYRLAIPDFYLKDTNTIIEIKSVFTLDIQNMKDKVKEYEQLGYNFKLILDHKETDINKL